MMGQAACGYPHKANAVSIAAQRLRLDRQGRGGMTGVHLAAFHGYIDSLRILLEGGAEPNAVDEEGETPLHTACTGGSIQCATILLEYGKCGGMEECGVVWRCGSSIGYGTWYTVAGGW